MANGNATPRQLWALYCATKLNTKNLVIGFEKARDLLNRVNSGQDIREELVNLGCEGLIRGTTSIDLEALFRSASDAGQKAVESLKVTPMVVIERENPLDPNSPVKNQYHVPNGPCGFASIVVRPGNCAFANYLKKKHGAYKHYYGGTNFPVRAYGQSMQMKEAYAYAFAKVLNEAGIKASVDSRLD